MFRKRCFGLVILFLFLLTNVACSSTTSKASDDSYLQENFCDKVQITTTPTKSNEVANFTLVGSVKNKEYHCPDCKNTESIKKEDKVSFSGSELAKSQGYNPCEVCSPPCEDLCEDQGCKVKAN